MHHDALSRWWAGSASLSMFGSSCGPCLNPCTLPAQQTVGAHLGGALAARQHIVGAEGGGAAGHQLEVVCSTMASKSGCVGGWRAVQRGGWVGESGVRGRGGAKAAWSACFNGSSRCEQHMCKLWDALRATAPAPAHQRHQRSGGWASWRGRSRRQWCAPPTGQPCPARRTASSNECGTVWLGNPLEIQDSCLACRQGGHVLWRGR